MATNSEKKEHEIRKKITDAYDSAKGFFDKDDHINALKKTENAISAHGNNEFCATHHDLQGDIFFKLANETDINDIKCVYLLASVDSYSASTLLRPNALRPFCGCVRSLIELGDQLGMNKFYVKAESKATLGLELSLNIPDSKDLEMVLKELKERATRKMKSIVAVTVSHTSSMVTQMDLGKEGDEEKRKRDLNAERLKSFWAELDDKSKRELLVVDLEKLLAYVKSKHNSEVQNHFQKCVWAENLRWRCWKCHICAQVNLNFADCKKHILDKHVHFDLGSKYVPKIVDKVLANMIIYGDWKPVDTVEATKLIKGRAERMEESVYVNGWCSDWPVAEDEDRKVILEQFAEVLKSCFINDTLSCTLWEWLMGYTEDHLELPQVPGIYLDKCSFFKSPQCICFLDLKHLEYILKYVRELTTDVRTSLVSTVVNRFWVNSLVKERIDLVEATSSLLLDENLLYEGEHHFDEIGEIKNYESSVIYENVIPNGNKIVSWVLDCPEIDKKFVSRVAEGVHNVEIWFAVLRIVRHTNRKMVKYHARKQRMLTYDKMLGEVEAICVKEDKRKNTNQRSNYAFSLRIKCKEHLKQQDDDTKCFLGVVRDVFEKAEPPSFRTVESGEYMELISRLSNTVENNVVKESLLRLRNSLKEKFRLIDSKMLLNRFTDAELNGLPKLSTIDYRLVVLQFVKIFLREKLEGMMKTVEEPEAKKQRS